ncbi:MAG: hypothetical protein PHU40_09960 [Sulfurimonas sp.]|nr:hypothetical protein [Sulfurimonas sp.]
MDTNTLELLQDIVDMQKDLVVVFEDLKPILTNAAFHRFFSVLDLREYNANYGPFANNLVPHPSYFNPSKVLPGQTWIEAIAQLDASDQIVSMMSSKYEPHAFAVRVQESAQTYQIVTFEDVTQTLIKRIMIENSANIDIQSGAYDKRYFMHIKESYEDAARFNEKYIALSLIELDFEDDHELQTFVATFRSSIREDDMLVRWAKEEFLFLYLVDDALKAVQVIAKLKNMFQKTGQSTDSYKLISLVQKENEKISALLKRMEQSQEER